VKLENDKYVVICDSIIEKTFMKYMLNLDDLKKGNWSSDWV